MLYFLKKKIRIVFFSLCFLNISCTHSTSVDKDNLIKNYELNKEDITDLIEYFDSIVPANTKIEIEIESTIFAKIFNIKQDGVLNNNWDIDLNGEIGKELMSSVGWGVEHIEELKLRLDAANCISINNFNNHTVGYCRHGMGIYNYIILEDSANSDVYEDCSYIKYNDDVIFEYVSGATGSLCFPE